MAEFRMPSLGADMDEGTLLEWLVHPGSVVHQGDIVAVVDTSKAAIEVECFDDGVIDKLVVSPGTRVPVGTVLATLTSGTPTPPGAPIAPAETAAAPPHGAVTPQAAVIPQAAVTPQVAASQEETHLATPPVRQLAHQLGVDLGTVHGTGPGARITHADVHRAAAQRGGPPAPAGAERPGVTGADRGGPGGRRVRASPRARRLATELGVDLATVSGSGPAGAIEADDVQHAATAAPKAAAPKAAEPKAAEPKVSAAGEGTAAQVRRAEGMRTAIATLMTRSKKEIPHYYLTETIDLGTAMAWLHDRNRALPVPERLVPAALLLKASAVAARSVPDLNGFWQDGRFVPADAVHLGVAIYLRGGGLVAPAIHHADGLTVADLMARLRDLVSRARTGRLRRAELADPTITVSNLGEQGVETMLGVIYPPQVALVGYGRVVERPWAVNGLLGVRPVVTASLAGDHRASDGAAGARYLQTVARLLSRPEEL